MLSFLRTRIVTTHGLRRCTREDLLLLLRHPNGSKWWWWWWLLRTYSVQNNPSVSQSWSGLVWGWNNLYKTHTYRKQNTQEEKKLSQVAAINVCLNEKERSPPGKTYPLHKYIYNVLRNTTALLQRSPKSSDDTTQWWCFLDIRRSEEQWENKNIINTRRSLIILNRNLI